MVSSSLPLHGTSNRFVTSILFFYYMLEGIVLYFVPLCLRSHKDIRGQIVLITGGASGIGQLMALKFARLGSTVVIWDLQSNALKQTAQLFEDSGLDTNKLFCYNVDISNRDMVYEIAQKVKQEVGCVDILINNAGVVTGKNLLDTPDDKIRLTFEVNVFSHFYTVKAFLPDMITRKRGHIVTIASVAGNLVSSNMSDYCASKFANVGFDLALRLELAQANLDKQIATSIVKPYFINTGMFAGARSNILPFQDPEYVADKIVQGIQTEAIEIVIPYYFTTLFWLLVVLPSKCLLPLADFMGSFEFMTHFVGRKEGKAQQHAPAFMDVNHNKLE